MLSDQALLVAIRTLSRPLAATAILHHISQPARTYDVQTKAMAIGFREIQKWNLTDALNQAERQGQVVKLPGGWSTLPHGLLKLKEAGIDLAGPMISETRHALHKHVSSVSDPERKRFLEEAIGCFDAKLWRAAVVFAWVGAIHILEEHIATNHLAAFNAAGKARFVDYKEIKNIKSFGSLQEADILQLCNDAGVISKSEKQELTDRLNLRNKCGHPNPIVVAEHAAANHIEMLILNVYSRY